MDKLRNSNDFGVKIYNRLIKQYPQLGRGLKEKQKKKKGSGKKKKMDYPGVINFYNYS